LAPDTAKHTTGGCGYRRETGHIIFKNKSFSGVSLERVKKFFGAFYTGKKGLISL
jgi:hypothetical protein